MPNRRAVRLRAPAHRHRQGQQRPAPRAGQGARLSDATPPRVVIVTRVGCHLCEVAVEAATAVATAAGQPGIGLLDVDGDLGAHSAQRAEWSDLVPVVLLDGRVHDVIRVDPARLRKALARKPGGRFRPW